MKVGMQERGIPVKVAHPFQSRQKVSGQGLITMEFIRTTTRVDERVVVDGGFSPMVMNTADRIVNIIWNTKVQEMHEEVADSIHDSFLIYDKTSHTPPRQQWRGFLCPTQMGDKAS